MPHQLDKDNMESIIDQFPGQFPAGLQEAKKYLEAAAREGILPEGPFGSVAFAGMGGSWMAGALVRDARLASVPIRIHRNYGLPDLRHLDRPLVIASSFSGNTRETISAYVAARDEGLPVMGITCGGELGELCEGDGKAWIKFPPHPPEMQPRNATGYTVAILTGLLERFGMAEQGAVAAIKALEKPLGEFMQPAREHARRILPGLCQATPVIYASEKYATVAQIFKIKINEHAKTAAFWNVFPELNHNEMEGWTQRRGPFHLIFLCDEKDTSCVVKRMDLTQKLLLERGLPSDVVPIEGASYLEKVFRTLLVADWAAYELALANGQDPTPVPTIKAFKDRLKALDEKC